MDHAPILTYTASCSHAIRSQCRGLVQSGSNSSGQTTYLICSSQRMMSSMLAARHQCHQRVLHEEERDSSLRSGLLSCTSFVQLVQGFSSSSLASLHMRRQVAHACHPKKRRMGDIENPELGVADDSLQNPDSGFGAVEGPRGIGTASLAEVLNWNRMPRMDLPAGGASLLGV